MASAFSHAVASFAIGKGINIQSSWKLYLAGMVCAVLPDADVAGFAAGIPYNTPFGHRGFTHSILFAVFLGALVASLLYPMAKHGTKKWRAAFLFLFLSTLSHGLLDAFTNGGLGVAFFFPFDNTRHFFPWRPIQVSPIGAKEFFGEWGLRVIKSELLWIWLPGAAIVLFSAGYNRLVKAPKHDR